MNHKNILLSITLLASAMLISACTGARGAATSWPGLTADQDNAYVAYNQQVYAINLSNGLEKWRFPNEADNKITFYAQPTLTQDGQLLAGSYNTVLYSLNPDTGQENWQFTNAIDRYIGGQLAVGKTIYAPNADGILYSLNLQEIVQWTFETEDAQWARPISDTDCTCIYIPSMDHRLYSIDAQSGEENWRTEDLGGSIVGTPAFDPEGVLYVGTFANEMLAIDAQNGQVLWRKETNDWVWGGPAFVDGRLYFGDFSGTFYALDAAKGQVLWEFESDDRITDTPLVTEDTIYFVTEAGSLYALFPDGSVRWNKTIGGKLYPSPVNAGDLILIAPIEAEALLYALDTDGNQQWTFTLEN